MYANGSGECRILGTSHRAAAGDAALANGVAAHALDFDDMCFVSLAHPSCALVPAILAAGEISQASGGAVLDGYVVGFEVECRLGVVMNPRHYHERGWHCTSSIGTVGAAAAAARVLGLTPTETMHARGIAASAACGLKENIGTMVKPLHAGMAARNGLMAARLAQQGLTASEQALDGSQGYLVAMDSERQASALADVIADLGVRWEILDSGITVKLYPSCAATHPPLDILLDLKRRHALTAELIDLIEVEVDSMTPRLLIHPRPATGLEAKFSMPFCAATAIVSGHPGVDTFEPSQINEPRIQALMPRVTLRTDPSFDSAPPLSQARVTIRLRDGRTVVGQADGARGYPGRLSEEELAAKFLTCAQRSLPPSAAGNALAVARGVGNLTCISTLTDACAVDR
jgi:2-methylcitrate dehydratase PrpD